MIPHFEHHFGAYLPEGGMYDIADSIYELGKRLGVTYQFAQRVDQICLPSLSERGRGRGENGLAGAGHSGER